jgi:hypothetical protein
MAAYLLSVFLFAVTCDPRLFGLDRERGGRSLLRGQDAIVIGLGPRQNHGPRRQTLFALKLFTGFQFKVHFVRTLLGLLAVPPNAAEVVLFFLLLLRDLGSKTVLRVGAQFAQIGAESAGALRRPGLQLLDDAQRFKSMVEFLIELKQDFINA